MILFYLSVFQFCASVSTTKVTTSSSSDGRISSSRSLLTGFVGTVQSEKLGKKVQISLLNMKEFLDSVVDAGTASLQQHLAVLKTEKNNGRLEMTCGFVCSER